MQLNNPPSELYRAIQAFNWPAALSILSSSDAQAQISCIGRGRCGEAAWTPLHWASCCRNNHVEVVRSILSLDPKMALAKDTEGCTPLHLAVQNSTEEIKMLLIEACPEAAHIPDKQGVTPFQRAVSGAHVCHRSKRLMNAFLQTGDEGKNYSYILSSAKQPAKKYFRKRWNMGIREVLKGIDMSSTSSPSAILDRGIIDDVGQESKVREVYDTILIYTRAFEIGKIKDSPASESLFPFHTVIKSDIFPWSFFALQMAANSEQVWRKDKDGNLPLHIAAIAKSCSDGALYSCEKCNMGFENTSWYQRDDFWFERYCPDCFSKKDTEDDSIYSYEEYDDDEEYEPEYSLVSPVDKIPKAIKQLLEMNSSAASIPNNEGRLPFNLAIESGKSYEGGIKAIFQAAPKALSTRDMTMHMYPCMMAAVGNENTTPNDGVIIPVREIGDSGKEGNVSNKSTEILQQFTLCFELLTVNPNLIRMKLPI